ncbi:hypothetical protein H4582DRAFT_1220526 [Lactarius indigo]|nr:hypothetical protein H4582DRAFT_1220526 [Lactarius indigo]
MGGIHADPVVIAILPPICLILHSFLTFLHYPPKTRRFFFTPKCGPSLSWYLLVSFPALGLCMTWSFCPLGSRLLLASSEKHESISRRGQLWRG